MNKKYLVILGILVVAVVTFSFVMLKGTGVENGGLNNLGSSSLGVPLINNGGEAYCAYGLKICGNTYSIWGWSTLKNTLAGARTSAIDDCKQKVSSEKTAVKNCFDLAKKDCKEPDAVCSYLPKL